MRDATIALSLTLLLIVGIVALTLRPVDQHEYFSVSIVQNGKVVEAHNGIVSLQKDSFQLVLSMKKPMSLIVLASHNTSWYSQVTRGVLLEKIIHPSMGYADTLFNSGRSLYLSDSGMNYWFYSDAQEHRFDEVAFQGNTITGVRTVEKLYYPEKNQEIEVKNCAERDIYLVFAYADYQDQARRYEEHQRAILQIEFH